MGLLRTARTLAGLSQMGIASPWSDGPPLSKILPDVFQYGLQVPEAVGRAEAMSIPGVARARNLLCPIIARIPLRADRGTTPLPVQPPWIARTDKPQSSFQRIVWTVDDLIFYGESLWLGDRGSAPQGELGPLLSVEHIPYGDWEVDSDSRLSVAGVVVTDTSRIIYIPGHDEGILCYGARAIREAVDLDRAAQSTARAPFKLELHQVTNDVLTDEEITALISKAQSALQQNGGILYTNTALEARLHEYTASNLLLEGRNYAAVDMARIVGVPAATIDAVLSGSGITYQTGPALSRALIDYGAAPYMAAITARLSLNDVTPNGTAIAFDVEGFLGPVAAPAADPAPPPAPPVQEVAP